MLCSACKANLRMGRGGACASCGALFPWTERWSVGWRLGAVVFGFVAMGVAVLILPMVAPKRSHPSPGLPSALSIIAGGGGVTSPPGDANAYSICKRLVRDRLRATSTADFPWTGTVKRTDATYWVMAYVDSQNGFGATVRTGWSCSVKYLGGDAYASSSWQVEDVSLSGP